MHTGRMVNMRVDLSDIVEVSMLVVFGFFDLRIYKKNTVSARGDTEYQ